MSSSSIRISVLIPCYNAEDCVGDAITSALDQTLTPEEIICVDDGSDDGTVDVIAAFARRHPGRIRLLQAAHGGAAAARNEALRAATGDYLQFLDADDLLAPTKLARQAELAEAADADLVAGAYWVAGLDGERFKIAPREEPWAGLISSKLGITSANLWRRSAVEACGAWSEDWQSSQEYELMFRMLKQGARTVTDARPLTTIRKRPGSISNWNDYGVRERHLRLRTAIFAHLAEEGRLEELPLDELLPSLFFKLRMLYPAAPDLACELHSRLIPADYVPPHSASNTLAYVLAYRLVGFRRAEALRGTLRTTLQGLLS